MKSLNAGDPCCNNSQHDGNTADPCTLDKGTKMKTANGEYCESSSFASGIESPSTVVGCLQT